MFGENSPMFERLRKAALEKLSNIPPDQAAEAAADSTEYMKWHPKTSSGRDSPASPQLHDVATALGVVEGGVLPEAIPNALPLSKTSANDELDKVTSELLAARECLAETRQCLELEKEQKFREFARMRDTIRDLEQELHKAQVEALGARQRIGFLEDRATTLEKVVAQQQEVESQLRQRVAADAAEKEWLKSDLNVASSEVIAQQALNLQASTESHQAMLRERFYHEQKDSGLIADINALMAERDSLLVGRHTPQSRSHMHSSDSTTDMRLPSTEDPYRRPGMDAPYRLPGEAPRFPLLPPRDSSQEPHHSLPPNSPYLMERGLPVMQHPVEAATGRPPPQTEDKSETSQSAQSTLQELRAEAEAARASYCQQRQDVQIKDNQNQEVGQTHLLSDGELQEIVRGLARMAPK